MINLLVAAQLFLFQPAPANPPFNDFDPAVFFVFLTFGAVFLVFIGISVAIGIVTILLVLVGLALSVFSASVLVGYLNRSVAAGFRTFVLAALSLSGIPAGILLLTVIQSLQNQPVDSQEIILGSIAGSVGGFVTGLVFLKLIVQLKTNVEVWCRLH